MSVNRRTLETALDDETGTILTDEDDQKLYDETAKIPGVPATPQTSLGTEGQRIVTEGQDITADPT